MKGDIFSPLIKHFVGQICSPPLKHLSCQGYQDIFQY